MLRAAAVVIGCELLVLATAVTAGCGGSGLPLMKPPPSPTLTAAPATASPEPASASPEPAPSATPFVLQAGQLLGPPDPKDPKLNASTPLPRAAAGRARAIVGGPEAPQTAPWTPPPARPQRAIRSVVGALDTGGQAGLITSSYKMDSPQAMLGTYAVVTVPTPDNEVNLDGVCGAILYSPTIKAPDGVVEASFDHWNVGGCPGGVTAHALRFYDFANGGWVNTGFDLLDLDFLGRYVRDFGLHGAQAELYIGRNRVFLANQITRTWDVLYTSPGGIPDRVDGWALLPETHYAANTPCPAFPPQWIDNFQVYQQATPPAAWGTPIASDGYTPEAPVAAYPIQYGDCFTATTNGGSYYEPSVQSAPNYGSFSVRTIP